MRDQKVYCSKCWGWGTTFWSAVCSENSDFYRRAGGKNKHCATDQRFLRFFVSGKSALPGNKKVLFLLFFYIFPNILTGSSPKWTNFPDFDRFKSEVGKFSGFWPVQVQSGQIFGMLTGSSPKLQNFRDFDRFKSKVGNFSGFWPVQVQCGQIFWILTGSSPKRANFLGLGILHWIPESGR